MLGMYKHGKNGEETCHGPTIRVHTRIVRMQVWLNDAASVGFTRRVGNTRLVHASLSQLLQAFPNTIPSPETGPTDSSRTCIALVFGREESGLTANELSLCTHSCSIPSGPVQPSLNLSHAVSVILAQLYEHRVASSHSGRHHLAEGPFKPFGMGQESDVLQTCCCIKGCLCHPPEALSVWHHI